MPIHNISKFLRSHFHLGQQRVRIHSERRLIIQIVGLQRSSDGKLPNAYKGRFDITTCQLALNISHSKLLMHAKIIIKIINEEIIILSGVKNKVFLRLLNKIVIEFI